MHLEGYGCACSDGLVLAGDGRTCTGRVWYMIKQLHNGDGIFTMQYVQLTPSYVIMPTVFLHSGNVTVLMTVVTIVMRITVAVVS